MSRNIQVKSRVSSEANKDCAPQNKQQELRSRAKRKQEMELIWFYRNGDLQRGKEMIRNRPVNVSRENRTGSSRGCRKKNDVIGFACEGDHSNRSTEKTMCPVRRLLRACGESPNMR